MIQARRFLICPPDHFDTHFLFNPWMSYKERVDKRLARSQWRTLVDLLESSGATVELMEPSPISGALVFTTDGALVYDDSSALVLRNDGPRGELEPRLYSRWLESHGYTTESLPPKYRLDGGNILSLGDGAYLVGLKPGSSHEAERYVSKLLKMTSGARAEPMHLVDNRYLHLDTVVGKLGDVGYLVFDGGLDGGKDAAANSRLAERDIIYIGLEETQNFACNCVNVGDTVITGPLSSATKRRVSALGLWVEELPLTEFYKAGGGAKCLTLPLDP